MAGRPGHRDVRAVLGDLLEVLRLPHDPVPGRPPGHPARAGGGRRDRRRHRAGRRSATSPCRCSARHPGQGVPVDHRRDPALRPGLGLDRAAGRSTPRRRWRSTCSSSASSASRSATAAPSPSILFLISLVFALVLPALRACAATSRARSPYGEPTTAPDRSRRRAGRSAASTPVRVRRIAGSGVRATRAPRASRRVVVVPILFAVLGGFKDTPQLGGQPARPARTRGSGTNYTDSLTSPQLLAAAPQQQPDRRRHHDRRSWSCSRRSPRSSSPASRSAAGSCCSRCSRSA